MLSILFSLQSVELLEKANQFLIRKDVDSAAYYLSKAYRDYPTEVENLIYIAYVEDTLLGGRLVKRLFPLIPQSFVVSQLALYELIKDGDYDEIASVYERADTLIPEKLRPFARFYKYVSDGVVDLAVSVADSISELYDFPWFENTDPFVKLLKIFLKDVAHHACSHFLISPCSRYLSSIFVEDDDFYVENYSYIAIYGLINSINYLNDFSRILDRLRSYGYILRSNRCRDGNTLRDLFVNLKYVRGSYGEADSVLEMLDWISTYCGDSLLMPIRVSRAMTLPHLDMTGYALDSLKALGDTFPDYTLTLLVDYGDHRRVKEMLDSILSPVNRYIPGLHDILFQVECEELYTDGKYERVIEECPESIEEAYAYIMLGKRDSGLMLLREQFPDTLRDNYADYWNRGWFYLLFGNTDSAMYYTKRALEYRPENPFLTMNLGSIYLTLGLVDSALHYYRLSFERNRRRRTYHWDYFFSTWRNDVKLLSKLFERDAGRIYDLMRRLRREYRK